MIKKFSSSRTKSPTDFLPKIPFWCSILELVRTHFAACGGNGKPPKI
ncbi:hypothetical protein KKH63_03105 [Patescibacteria group bacterium]|nr:hypothetical protein [Patescibacteria group bacterium]